MGLSKKLFMEDFERQVEEEDRYIFYSKMAEEFEWQEQLKKLQKPKNYIKVQSNGKFTKKTKKRVFSKVRKGYEKSSNPENNEKVFYQSKRI